MLRQIQFAVLLAVMARFQEQMVPTNSSLKGTLTADKSSFALGENIQLSYCLDNPTDKPILLTVGRATFNVTAKDSVGKDQPQVKQPGETSYWPDVVGAGKRWCHTITLSDYVTVSAPRTLKINVVFTSFDSPFVDLDRDGRVVLTSTKPGSNTAPLPAVEAEATVILVAR